MMKLLVSVVLLAGIINCFVARNDFGRQVVQNVMRYAPHNAQLLRYSGPLTGEDIKERLIDNATLIRENIIGGFTCKGKVYGYYADTNNDCQIFHVCVPLKQLFPNHYGEDDIWDFSFICPKYTIFTQDAMVCAFERSAVPCEHAPDLYHLNNNFFVVEDVPKLPKPEPEPEPAQ